MQPRDRRCTLAPLKHTVGCFVGWSSVRLLIRLACLSNELMAMKLLKSLTFLEAWQWTLIPRDGPPAPRAIKSNLPIACCFSTPPPPPPSALFLLHTPNTYRTPDCTANKRNSIRPPFEKASGFALGAASSLGRGWGRLR